MDEEKIPTSNSALVDHFKSSLFGGFAVALFWNHFLRNPYSNEKLKQTPNNLRKTFLELHIWFEKKDLLKEKIESNKK